METLEHSLVPSLLASPLVHRLSDDFLLNLLIVVFEALKRGLQNDGALFGLLLVRMDLGRDTAGLPLGDARRGVVGTKPGAREVSFLDLPRVYHN